MSQSTLTYVHTAYDYTSHFQSDQVPTWYTIKPAPISTSGSYQIFAAGNPKPAVPAAASGQGSAFNVDHVLELQVIGTFIQAGNPNPYVQSTLAVLLLTIFSSSTVIPDASWKSLRDVITNTTPMK